MEKPNEESKEGGCCSKPCGGCCWGKAAVGLFLLLIGMLMGFFFARNYGSCGSNHACPLSGMVCPVTGATSAPSK